HVWVKDPVYLTGEADHDAEALVIHFNEDFLGKEFMGIPELERFKKILKLSERGLVLKYNTQKEIIAIMNKMPEMNGLQRLSSLFGIFDIMSSTTEFEVLASPKFIQNFHYYTSERFKRVTEYILHNF